MLDFQMEKDFLNYLNSLNEYKKEHIIVIAVKDTIGFCLEPQECATLNKLGAELLRYKSSSKELHWRGYVALIAKGVVVYEHLGEMNETVHYINRLDDLNIEIWSSPYLRLNLASIRVNDCEYAVNKRGLNFVIIDYESRKVVDVVDFDTHVDSKECFRRFDTMHVSYLPVTSDGRYIRNIDEVVKRLSPKAVVNSIAPLNETKKKKIKIRFFYWGGLHQWASLESMAIEFASDEKFDVLIISVNDDFENKKRCIENSGLRAINGENYVIGEDNPSIAVMNNRFDCTRYNYFKNVSFVFQVPTVLINGFIEKKDYEKAIFRENLFSENELKTDAIIADPAIYKELKEIENVKNKLYKFGNPKYDFIYDSLQIGRNSIPYHWNKIKGKIVVLWAFDHNWNQSSVTFDLYYKTIFEFANTHKEIAIIVRPHPNYIQELIASKIWNIEQLQLIKAMCLTSDSIVWDDSDNYGMAYSIADAVITDINCGVSVTAITLQKPLALLLRYDGNFCAPNACEIYEGLYHIYSENSLIEFMKMLLKQEDSMAAKRKKLFDTYIEHFDGKNGKRIKDFIVKNYLSKAFTKE